MYGVSQSAPWALRGAEDTAKATGMALCCGNHFSHDDATGGTALPACDGRAGNGMGSTAARGCAGAGAANVAARDRAEGKMEVDGGPAPAGGAGR